MKICSAGFFALKSRFPSAISLSESGLGKSCFLCSFGYSRIGFIRNSAHSYDRREYLTEFGSPNIAKPFHPGNSAEYIAKFLSFRLFLASISDSR